MSTYHAYAGGLISEHGLRLGFEPDLRVVSDATRYQLAARVVAAAPGLQTSLSGHLPTVVQYLLDLDAQLQDHLVRPEQVRSHGRMLRARLADEKQLKDVVRAVDTTRARDDLLGLVAAYRQAKADVGIAEFADQMAWGARLPSRSPRSARPSASGSGSCCSTSTRTRRCPSAGCCRACSAAAAGAATR